MCENGRRIDCESLQDAKGIIEPSEQEKRFTEASEYIIGQVRFDYEEWLNSPVEKGEAILKGVDPRTF